MRPPRLPLRWLAVGIFVATFGQLLFGSLASGLSQFSGKGFVGRLVAYPLLMWVVPAVWALRRHIGGGSAPLPWAGFAFIMAPFLIDATGNTLNLYDTVTWWDDANHLVNWFLLCTGIGLLLMRANVSPPWALGVLVAGVGALLAVLWELAEWYTFIRHGTELDTAYQDTLGDEVLGILGAALAGGPIAVLRRRSVA